MRKWLSLPAALLLAAACADKPNPFEQVAPPLSERREPLVVSAATLDLNADCKNVGRTGCKSGVCFQAGPDEFHCSQECKADSDCGDPRLQCAQVAPDSAQGWYCVRARAKSRPVADAGAP